MPESNREASNMRLTFTLRGQCNGAKTILRHADPEMQVDGREAEH